MARPSSQQWAELLRLISQDKELLHGQFLGPNGLVRTRQKWAAIADKVNTVAGATVQKDGDQWKLAWMGVKTRARASLRSMAAYRKGTGGGPDVEIAGLGLSELHEKVLNLTGITAAIGTSCPDPLQIQLQVARAPPNQLVDQQIYISDLEQDESVEAEIEIPDADELLNMFVLHEGQVGNPQNPPAKDLSIIDLTALEENDWGTALAAWAGPSKIKFEKTDENFLSVPNASASESWTGPSKLKQEEADNSPSVPNNVSHEFKVLHTPPRESGLTPCAKKANQSTPEIITLTDTPQMPERARTFRRRLQPEGLQDDHNIGINVLKELCADLQLNLQILSEVMGAVSLILHR